MLRGGCQCGETRYEVVADPVDLYVCHCRECQAQSASAFGISVIVQSENLHLVAGETKVWTRPAAIGGTMDCHFCPTCGTRLWHGNPESNERVSVKGGSLDQKPDLTGAKHIWTARTLPGVVIPEGCETFPGEPREG